LYTVVQCLSQAYNKNSAKKQLSHASRNYVLRIAAYVRTGIYTSTPATRETMMERSGPIDDWLFSFLFQGIKQNVFAIARSLGCFSICWVMYIYLVSFGRLLLCVCICMLSTAGHLNVPPRT
jgi:hypothetical protein